MDIKDLNKPQLIMLAVLLSFVTSIATGITTVTLMQQAPTSVITPINRVVRQTVEKIQQVEGKTVTQTVVVKEEDLVVDAIEKNKSSAFTITKEIIDENGKTVEVSLGRGFLVSADNIVAIDGSVAVDKGIYYVKNDSGKFKADFVSNDKAGFSLLKIGAPLDDKNKLVASVPSFGSVEKMKIGQKIIILGNNISTLIFDNKNINITANKSNMGGMVLNLDGEVLGMVVSADANNFLPIKSITDTLKPAATSSDSATPKQ
jgi:S1-C subfamily serine protease